MMTQIRLTRAYDPPTDADGYRILVDRLWPRGVAKAKLDLDAWDKEVAPSTSLREWFGHEVPKWTEFEKRYRAELSDNPAFGQLVATCREHPVVTLIFGARDTEHNEAVVLAQDLRERLGKQRVHRKRSARPIRDERFYERCDHRCRRKSTDDARRILPLNCGQILPTSVPLRSRRASPSRGAGFVARCRSSLGSGRQLFLGAPGRA